MSDRDQAAAERAKQRLREWKQEVAAWAAATDSTAADDAFTDLLNALTDAAGDFNFNAAEIPSDEEEAGHSYLAEIEALRADYRARAL